MIGGAKGIGIGLDFGIGNIKRPTKRDTLDPAIKEALCGVWIADQNTNESPTRNIIKNKISGKGGDFEILNAAYKLNSGYGKYNYDYTTFGDDSKLVKILSAYKIEYHHVQQSVGIFNFKSPSYKGRIKVTGVEAAISSKKVLSFKIYTNSTDDDEALYIIKDGIYDINILGEKATTFYMFLFGASSNLVQLDSPVYIEQIPNYQGAFCTDGVDDLIVSQKPVSEMLGGSNELTVVSMIHQITANETNVSGSLNSNNKYFSNVTLKDKVTGIYGYSIKHIDDYYAILINNILGDKNNYNERSGTYLNSVPEFSVEGCRVSSKIEDVSQVAWYWTLIAKRVLTTDEINQVIAYYNLDKYVAPDIYYDVKKQGITNENHAEFGDKLIDYSGNGKDMQLYNFGWKLDSGVGKYETDWSNGNLWINRLHNKYTSNKIEVIAPLTNSWIIFSKDTRNTSFPSYTVRITGIKDAVISYIYVKEDGNSNTIYYHKDGIYIVPESFSQNSKDVWTGFSSNNLNIVGLTIEQLPSYENALVFNGVNDYGQYVGDLGLKDYTVVADRAYVEIMNSQVPIISSMSRKTGTPFIIEHCPNELKMVDSFSFDKATRSQEELDIDRKISYQSTYVYNSNTITKGTSTNTGDGFTFGRFGGDAQYAKLCLYNFMLFPYSLSEFLIERQLKKRKLGTLYPVVKFNPIIEGNMPFEVLKYEKISETNAHLDLKIGDYVPIGQEICISIKLSDNTYKLSNVSSSSLTDINFGSPPNSPYASIYGKVTDKSPQDVTIHIENNQQGGG